MSSGALSGKQSTSESALAAYFAFHTEGDGHWGAVLLVNADGLPDEFLYTGPIRPTAAQAILYGPTMTEVVRGRMIVEPLLAALRIRPCCVLYRESTPPLSVQASQTVGILQSGDVLWQGIPSEKAASVVDALSQTDVLEPLVRAETALKYVVEHETERRTASDPPRPSFS